MINTRPKLLALAGQVTTKQLREAKNYLTAKRVAVAKYPTIEDLAVDTMDHPDPLLSGFEHHFLTARNAVLRKLWSKGVLIGASVIENLLFTAVCETSVVDPIAEVFVRIKDLGLHKPGFVLYPLHSFGIVGAGLIGFMQQQHPYFIDDKAGIAITSQTNSKERLVEFLDAATKQLKMRKRIPADSLDHYLRGGVLKWLTDNPLMLVKCKTFSGEYYENQFLLIIKLKLASVLVVMLYGVQKPVDTARLYSTSTINNYETHDIKHYIVFQPALRNRRRFVPQRIPMNLSRAELSELSELNIELNPDEWRYRPKLFTQIAQNLQIVERGYMENCVGSKADTVKSRVYSKIFLALDYFRRSFRNVSKSEYRIIDLAIAFETLLTDHYSPNVKGRIERRTTLLLRGVRGCRAMSKAVAELSNLRNISVHTGKTSNDPDWQQCRLAFIHCFLELSRRFSRLGTSIKQKQSPISELIGD